MIFGWRGQKSTCQSDFSVPQSVVAKNGHLWAEVADNQTSTTAPRAPLGSYRTHVDDKGRLKLPGVFQKYLKALSSPELFATSLDRRTAQIYPISTWLEIVSKLREADGDNAKRVNNVFFSAQELGAECEMDTSGRVLLSTELRRTLGMENQPVYVQAVKGRIDVMGEELFSQRRAEASATAIADVEALEMARLL
jgi:DNA-binding transcriptional regulator/RsmH inhibitor MraZ